MTSDRTASAIAVAISALLALAIVVAACTHADRLALLDAAEAHLSPPEVTTTTATQEGGE